MSPLGDGICCGCRVHGEGLGLSGRKPGQNAAKWQTGRMCPRASCEKLAWLPRVYH